MLKIEVIVILMLTLSVSCWKSYDEILTGRFVLIKVEFNYLMDELLIPY